MYLSDLLNSRNLFQRCAAWMQVAEFTHDITVLLNRATSATVSILRIEELERRCAQEFEQFDGLSDQSETAFRAWLANHGITSESTERYDNDVRFLSGQIQTFYKLLRFDFLKKDIALKVISEKKSSTAHRGWAGSSKMVLMHTEAG